MLDMESFNSPKRKELPTYFLKPACLQKLNGLERQQKPTSQEGHLDIVRALVAMGASIDQVRSRPYPVSKAPKK